MTPLKNLPVKNFYLFIRNYVIRKIYKNIFFTSNWMQNDSRIPMGHAK
jgi:hypothetical protein